MDLKDESASMYEEFDTEYEEAKFFLYNFHKRSAIEELEKGLLNENQPRLLLLAGDKGIGRRYFLESAVFKLAYAGNNINIASIDLDGCEPDQKNIERYLKHQQVKYRKLDSKRIDALLEYASVPPTVVNCAVFSIALSINRPLEEVLALFPFNKKNNLPAKELFKQFLASLSEKSRLVIRTRSHEHITDALKLWLYEETEVNPGLIVAFSCEENAECKNVLPFAAENQVQVHRIRQLEQNELRISIDANFSPNGFTDEFYDAIGRYSHGYPAVVASKMFDMVSEGSIENTNEASGWSVSGNCSLEELQRQCTAKICEPLETFLETLPPDLAPKLESFIYMSVLCGETIPVKMILEQVGVREDMLDEMIDLIDDNLMLSTPIPLFVDYQYAHPSFDPKVLVYGFSNSVYQKLMLDRLISREEEYPRAFHLMEFLVKRLDVASRGAAGLFLNISRFLEEKESRIAYHCFLAWWVSKEETADLVDYLVKSVNAGRDDPAMVWAIAAKQSALWPPYRILALLEVYQHQTFAVRRELLPQLHHQKCILYNNMGMIEDALAEAEEGVAIAGSQDSAVKTDLHFFIGRLMFERVDAEKAEHHLGISLNLAQRNEPDSLKTAQVMEMNANLFSKMGRLEKALELQSKSVDIRTKQLGATHFDVAFGQMLLGDILWNLKKPEAFHELNTALKTMLRYLAVDMNQITPHHAHLARVYYLLGCTITDQADLKQGSLRQASLKQAESAFRSALDIEEALNGADNINTAYIFSGMAKLYGKLNQPKKVNRYFEESTRIFNKNGWGLHPDALQVMQTHIISLKGEGRNTRAKQLEKELRSKEEKVQQQNKQ